MRPQQGCLLDLPWAEFWCYDALWARLPLRLLEKLGRQVRGLSKLQTTFWKKINGEMQHLRKLLSEGPHVPPALRSSRTDDMHSLRDSQRKLPTSNETWKATCMKIASIYNDLTKWKGAESALFLEILLLMALFPCSPNLLWKHCTIDYQSTFTWRTW